MIEDTSVMLYQRDLGAEAAGLIPARRTRSQAPAVHWLEHGWAL